MKIFWSLLSKLHPVCPITRGALGPYEYEQFIKDGKLTFETPLSCLEFLKIGEFMPKLYEVDPKRTLWLNRDELTAIKAHKHTVER